MPVLAEPIDGVLFRNASAISVTVSGSSRYSFHARLSDTAAPIDPVCDFDRLQLTFDNQSIDLGACRFLLQPNSSAAEGRIVFRDEQYDLTDLLLRRKLTSSTAIFNLPLILAQKDRVTQEFKEFSANLTFELSVYKQFLDEIDRQYLNEPAIVQDHLQKLFIEKEGPGFLNFFHEKVQQLRSHARTFTREQNEVHGFFFRKQIWEFILLSRFMMRTNLKPRGYAGDYEMMKMIYENDYAGASIFSKLMHKYPLEVEAARAVRNRRMIIPQMVAEAVDRAPLKRPFRILSLACGPAVEAADFFRSEEDAARIELTLADQDEDALFAARQQIEGVEKRIGRKVKARYINDSVRTMLRKNDLSHSWGDYDFVYSMGLFDYLTPPVARAVTSKVFQLLRPAGQLVIGNFHRQCPDREFLEYWLDWVLYYRSEEEFLELTESLDCSACSVFLEDSKCQMFLQVQARG